MSPRPDSLPSDPAELQRIVLAFEAENAELRVYVGETPETWRPRFARRNDGSFDPFHWSIAFLLATGYATRLWRPVLRGHAATSDIIAPIRDTTGVNSRLDDAGVAAVAKAVVAIRSYFMPQRVRAARI
ncbi:MAG: hypothetical protein E5X74_23550 [Mesorhizobium sp.]|nr:MAG: hypothetical protein E5X74_23550 [Mesorhizobium sp.]